MLAKFQQEKSVGDQQAVLLWLKTLLRLHWALIVQVATGEDLGTLSQIQTYIQRKTASMDKLLLLKGKLEMAKRTIQLQKSSFVNKLAIQNGGSSTQKGPLVYKDAPDGDSSEGEEDNEDMESGEDEDMMGDDSSEEEIKEIPLKKLAEKNLKKKRAKMQGSDEDVYGDEQSDDSEEADRYEPEPSQKKKAVMEASDADYDDEDDSDVDRREKNKMSKLADSSDDGDDAMMDDGDESSDGEGDIIKK